jgi:glycogen phosphorylase
MAFQIQPLREILVRPALPAALSRLTEIAYNFMWSWDHNVRAIFRRLDPVLWKQSNHNPVVMLGRIPQQALEKAAADPRYIAVYKRACERYDAYAASPGKHPGQLVAYFSMEYGLLDCMPIYSGGLGVLSGDHLKSSSDAEIPLIGVGLLYQKGYLTQVLNPDGWQSEKNPVNDFYTLPVRPCKTADGGDVVVHVDLPTGRVFVKVWWIEVGRVKLYLLDTNIPENEPEFHRDITDMLYGGDSHTRIRQEIVLGIGGLRALEVLGLKPTVYHMNEGHSAFIGIERIRLLMDRESMSFDEAVEAVRVNSVFTTHTSVPAGIDLFENGLVYEYFSQYCVQAGIPFEQFLALGRRKDASPQERFSMAILAMGTSSYRNAVSMLHRGVSQDMWQDLWPNLPTWEVPITSVTNGVHLPTWVNGDLASIYDQHLDPDWRDRNTDPKVFESVKDIPAQELWEAHKKRKRRTVQFLRDRTSAAAIARKAPPAEIRKMQELFDPEVFTIGFARRFATYKRATLIFKDFDRLKKLLNDPKHPVQIIIAGKAHPKDIPGKTLIKEIVTLSRDPELNNRLIFLEDYGIHVAREMVQGVDLWLNNPRRGEEACGTSGMKAAMNGVLNLSILDGWFDEAYEQSGSWAIGGREDYSEDQDILHARAIYSILENEILPAYYGNRDAQGVPAEWMRRAKQSLMYVSPYFSCQRMVEEYHSALYAPSHRAWEEASANGFEKIRARARWNKQVQEVWPRVQFTNLGPDPGHTVLTGSRIPLEASVEMAGLRAEDVRVEAVVGRVGVTGQLEDTQVVVLPAIRQTGSVITFGREFLPHQTGRLGYALRVSPNHFEDPLTRSCYALLRWGQ